MRVTVGVLEDLMIIPREIMQCSPGRHGEGEEHGKRRSIVMQEIEDLEKKMGTENVAESAMVEGRELIDVCGVARIATERLGTNELSVMIQGVMGDGLEQEPWEIAERLDILLFSLMGKEEWRTDLDVVDRGLSIIQERLEVQQLSETLTSAQMDIVSAQERMTEAEEAIEETTHRLDSLLVRLKEAERESDR
ncbi:MAG: hypothetical protein LN415_04190 [Candidatus Thermoplasmatota archaeon]|nr:hypothetical protein [Candidatus Thermoplasmatota archaeon]